MPIFGSGHQGSLHFLVILRFVRSVGLRQPEVEDVVHEENRQEEDPQSDVCSCHGDDAVTRRGTVSRQRVLPAPVNQRARVHHKLYGHNQAHTVENHEQGVLESEILERVTFWNTFTRIVFYIIPMGNGPLLEALNCYHKV